MAKTSHGSSAFWIALSLAAGLVAIFLAGLLIPQLYGMETLNWRLQTIGQDLFDVAILAPLLLLGSGFIGRRSYRYASRLMTGVYGYALYTFFIYCFSIHQNTLFLVYCACLGLSFFGFISTAGDWQNAPVPPASSSFVRFVALYLIVLALTFAFMWLSEIVPAMLADSVPVSLHESGLPVNPVYVLDLSIFLPLLFITGIKLLRGSKVALSFVPSILVFLVLMSLTISFLTVFLTRHQFQGSLSVAVAMGILAVTNIFILIRSLKRNGGTR